MRRLAESEHLITRTMKESGEGLVIGSRDGRIEYVNPAFEVMTGYAKHELVAEK